MLYSTRVAFIVFSWKNFEEIEFIAVKIFHCLQFCFSLSSLHMQTSFIFFQLPHLPDLLFFFFCDCNEFSPLLFEFWYNFFIIVVITIVWCFMLSFDQYYVFFGVFSLLFSTYFVYMWYNRIIRAWSDCVPIRSAFVAYFLFNLEVKNHIQFLSKCMA